MLHYLIMCRSLTYAQKIVSMLERAGIHAWLMRSPTAISPTGCSYSVKITHRDLPRALMVLNQFRLPYMGIYLGSAEDGYREVEL